MFDTILYLTSYILHLNIGYLNYFFNRCILFVECPAGFYGKNCSILCPPPSYGCSCAKTCDCPVCHYIVGCIFTPKSTGIHIGNTYADISFYKSHNFYNFMLNTNKIDISKLVK